MGSWKLAVGLDIPANYTPADPYDIGGKTPLINAMQVDWWDMPPEQAKQVIINAFRATMLSPRMNLKSNAILYQSLMHVPADESDPDVFENAIRDLKAKWDTQGQIGLGQDPEDVIDPNEILPGKFMPGFWGNIRRLAGLGPYADELYKLAMDDMQHGGDGHIFRNGVLALGIPGVQSKVASFAWLALAPNTSELATIDVHMMRHLNEDGDSPRNTKHYLQLEDRLRNERDETYGTEVPLAHYQWGVWDARRTPGFHQDHTPLRAYQPTPFLDVAWPPPARPPRTREAPIVNPEQQSLLGRFEKTAATFPWEGTNAGIHNGTVSLLADAGVQARITFPRTAVHPEGATFTLPQENPFMYTMDEMFADSNPYPVQVETNDDPEYVKVLLDAADRGVYNLQQLERMNNRNVSRWKWSFSILDDNPSDTQVWHYVYDKTIDAGLDEARAQQAADRALQFWNVALQTFDTPTKLRQLDNYVQELADGRTSLGKWTRTPAWMLVRTAAGGYTIQGKLIAGAPNSTAQGVAVRPDRQSQEEIMEIINNLPTHRHDYLKQRELIPDWALNRGGKTGVPQFNMIPGGGEGHTFKIGDEVTGAPGSGREGMRGYIEAGEEPDQFWVQWYPTDSDLELRRANELLPFGGRHLNLVSKVADFERGPGGTGVTYAPSVICVSEWVDVDDNWLLEHPACRGIVAQKGGAASHGVVVARQRNIAIVVDVPEADRIEPGDNLQVDSSRAIIYINGGTAEEFGEAEVAQVPVIRFVWSLGHGLTAPVPQDDPESGTLHREMIMQQYRNGQWDRVDNALGVVYSDGHVDMLGQPSDQEDMVAWLNTIHPITNVEHGFNL